MQVQMHLCAGQHTNVVELRALCQHDAALYMVMVSCVAVGLVTPGCGRTYCCCHVWMYTILAAHLGSRRCAWQAVSIADDDAVV
jgi:hypothetical protein